MTPVHMRDIIARVAICPIRFITDQIATYRSQP